jgi:hypothetical protein
MYDADIQSMDAAAKEHSWMAPQVSTGLFMTPYNINPDMGSYMIGVTQNDSECFKAKS